MNSRGKGVTRPGGAREYGRCVAPTAQPEKLIADLAREYFLSANSHDTHKMMEFWQPGGEAHIIGITTLRAPEGYHEWFGALFRAVPDIEVELIDVIAEGEKVVVHWRMTGTFDGEGIVEGIAPTGALIDMQGMDILTVRDGLIQHLEAVINGMELARQMGAMPPAGSAADRALLRMVNARTSLSRWTKRRRDQIAPFPYPGRGPVRGGPSPRNLT